MYGGIWSSRHETEKAHLDIVEAINRFIFYSLVIFSDFNEILHPCENNEGNERQLSLINDFREVLRDCDLLDIGYKGYPFTWSNGRFGPAFVKERLDSFVCNSAWRDIFSDCAATNIDTWTPDHCPVLMEIQERGAME